ncbi:hypothetical protein ACLB1Q_26645 [Escherichia coli]
MIAYAGMVRFKAGATADLGVSVHPALAAGGVTGCVKLLGASNFRHVVT